jgi:hypothetical protein
MATIDSGEDAEGRVRLERLAKSFRASYLAGTSHGRILPLPSARRKRGTTAIKWVVARGVHSSASTVVRASRTPYLHGVPEPTTNGR